MKPLNSNLVYQRILEGRRPAALRSRGTRTLHFGRTG